MTISDETLMAYADGELDPAARAAVEAVMRENPDVERRVAQHRALRERIRAAYAPELSMPIPDQLMSTMTAAWSEPGANVIDLQAARNRGARKSILVPARSAWRSLASLAASVLVGVGIGYFVFQQTQSPFMRRMDGGFAARGDLAHALSTQLVAEQAPGSAVSIGLSFLAKSGDYCRTFVLSGTVAPSGIACRHGQEWQIESLVQEPAAPAGTSEYRTAASPVAAAILKSVEDQIVGEPLDRASEELARKSGWVAVKR